MASYRPQYNLPGAPDRRPGLSKIPSSASRLLPRPVPGASSSQQKPVAASTSIPSAKLTKKKRLPGVEQTQSTMRPAMARQGIPAPSGLEEHSRRIAGHSAGPISGHANPQTNLPQPYRGPRLDPPLLNASTPSLVSGSSASTIDSPRSVLRQKPTVGDKSAVRGRPVSTTSQEELPAPERSPSVYSDSFPDNTVFNITLPHAPAPLSTRGKQNIYHPDNQASFHLPPRLATSDLPPPAPLYAASTSPSTRYSGSPFSHTSTPTSLSSHSPGITVTARNGPRRGQPSPTRSRPPVSLPRRMTDENEPLDPQDPHGLAAVRESSSSSNASTVRASDNARYNGYTLQSKRKDSHGSPNRPRSNSVGSVQSPMDNSRSPPHIKPEFAHLVDMPLAQGPPAIRPRRPSREGTEGTMEFLRLREPSPIIQSNLNHLPYPTHRRQSSGDSKTGVALNSKARFGVPTKSTSRNPSPNPSLTSSFSPPPPLSRATTGTTPELSSDTEKLPATSSPNKSGGSRFGFFRRAAKADPAAIPNQGSQGHRKLRKGPSAGTGHEGYGRHATRGRSGSTTSGGSVSVGRSASSDSISGSAAPRTANSRKNSGASHMDDFLLERLNPVTLRGGSAQSSTDKLTEIIRSPSSLDTEHLSPLTAVHSPPQNAMSGTKKPTLLPSPLNEPVQGGSPNKRPSVKHEAPIPVPRAEPSSGPSLTSRRFSRKSLNTDFNNAIKISTSVGTDGTALLSPLESPTMDPASADAGHSANEAKERGWFWTKKAEVKPEIKPEPVTRPRLNRKWNFFQRARNSSPERARTPGGSSQQSRSVPHYALMQAGGVDLAELDELMQEADNGPDEPLDLPDFAPIPTPFAGPGAVQGLSILVPDAPVFSQQTPHHVRAETPVSPKGLRPELSFEHQEPLTPTSVCTDIDPRPSSFTSSLPAPHLPPPHTLTPPQSQTGDALQVPVSTWAPVQAPVQAPIQVPAPAPAPVPVSAPAAQSFTSQTYLSPTLPPMEEVNPPAASTNRPRPRLLQVGRIPAVVSRRDRERVLPISSFSRPFAPSQPAPSLPSHSPVLPEQVVVQPTPVQSPARGSVSSQTRSPPTIKRRPSDFGAFAARNLPQIPSHVQVGNSKVRNHIEAIMPKNPRATVESPPIKDFLKFSRKNSAASSYSTTSTTSNMVPIAAPIAVIPKPGMPPGEDEVWNEYDDLIDDVLSPSQKLKTPISAGSSLGAPFHYSRLLRESNHPGHRKRRSDETEKRPSRIIVSHKTSRSTDSALPSLRTPPGRSSRLLSVLAPLATPRTPRTPMSISEFYEGYGERNNLSVIDPVSGRLSFPTNRTSSGSGNLSVPSHGRRPSEASTANGSNSAARRVSGDGSEPSRHRRIEMAENQDNGLASMANLRFGALMTSKWLSFGRVLFSPAHFELNNKEQDRVLILDGLGKDWSYYVALTYPNASVYNLDPNPNELSQNGESNQLQGLPNHRHIHHPHLAANFPFPRGFFAAVVFRFPVATSEAAYRAAVYECKRVLRPGGYLEISMLDLDMVNMGNKARRAVRELKMQMQVVDTSVSLKPVTDNIQKLLGRRGFENLNRCIVGVPTAGRIAGGGDGLNGAEDQDVSFSDLLNDSTRQGDERITNMVAKVGRWWYSRCYEAVALQDGDLSKSIWNDEELVRECEKKGTNFRLLICYAQKPSVTVRRTVSV